MIYTYKALQSLVTLPGLRLNFLLQLHEFWSHIVHPDLKMSVVVLGQIQPNLQIFLILLAL